MCSEDLHTKINRRDFLKIGGAGLAGAVLLGTGGRALAQTETSLKQELGTAAREYEVPPELLLAMGYVNTLWEMPPAEVSDYEPGELHGRGEYGIMQLAQNSERDTLGKAANLTGLSEKRLKTERAANIRGGAALLSEIAGETKPGDLNGWRESVAEYADIDLYATEVYETLEEGASSKISTGEEISLPSQQVEVPVIYEAMGSWTDYGRAIARPAHGSNFTYSRRERTYNIKQLVVHVAEGGFSSTIRWFKNPSANVSAHYVVARNGTIAQCVKHKNIGWHAGKWGTNTHSIGIEHAGYGRYAHTWSRAMYRASARLAGYICKRHRIPVDGRHIVPHKRIVATKCPGKHFNMQRYRKLVRRYKRRM